MAFRSCDTVHFPEAVDDTGNVDQMRLERRGHGAFAWERLPDEPVRLYIVLPIRISDFRPEHAEWLVDLWSIRIAVSTAAKENGRWLWDGNEELPTLSPSIQSWTEIRGERLELWHGFLKAGVLSGC